MKVHLIKSTEQYVEKLENKLIRANKRITKWRGLTKQYRFDANMEAERVEYWMKISTDWKDTSNYWSNRYIKANLKQKKAWIAFYIVTIIYIVGVVWIAIH